MKNKNFDMRHVIGLTLAAGNIIMYHRGNVKPEFKDDSSPVTKADTEASELLVKGLVYLTPDIPVISEENDMASNLAVFENSETYWIIDPLDGTKSFIGGYDGFGVHVGLVHKGQPVAGVAFFPAQLNGAGKLYYTDNDGKAYVKEGQNQARLLIMEPNPNHPLKAAMGYKDKAFSTQVDVFNAVGGARFCVTAEGLADIAQFNAPFSYWDVVAGHAILKAAGGDFYDLNTGAAIEYCDISMVTPPGLGGLKKQLEPFLKNRTLSQPRLNHPKF